MTMLPSPPARVTPSFTCAGLHVMTVKLEPTFAKQARDEILGHPSSELRLVVDGGRPQLIDHEEKDVGCFLHTGGGCTKGKSLPPTNLGPTSGVTPNIYGHPNRRIWCLLQTI